MVDYGTTFVERAISYLHAMQTYPDALAQEFANALDILQPRPGDVILNIPAGGVPLEKHVHRDCALINLEFNKEFCDIAHVKQCAYNKIPLDNCSVDKIISIASLHHLSLEERQDFYRECHRILKPDGRFVIADVLKGSKQDVWLNKFVNEHNSKGHNGLFWTESDAGTMDGFNVSICTRKYDWVFTDNLALLDFSRNLFGLDRITDMEYLQGSINEILTVKQHENKTLLEWELIYFVLTPQCTEF
jgi:SAM-dependent methyltransferase